MGQSYVSGYGARPLGSALGAIIGGLYSAEACLYLAALIFAAQAAVILMSPAVALTRQPDMVGECAGAAPVSPAAMRCRLCWTMCAEAGRSSGRPRGRAAPAGSNP